MHNDNFISDEKMFLLVPRRHGCPFAIEQFWGDYKKVKEMNFKEDDEEVKMNELPTTLTNYYISVPNQNSKLSLLTKLLLTDCAN